MQAVMAGEANLLFDPANTAIPQVKAGRVHAVATPAQKRGLPGMPDLPSISETIPDFYFEGVQGIAMHPATPREIISRLHTEVVRVLATPEVRDQLTSQGADVVGNSPEEFSAWIKAEVKKWADVVKVSGAKID